VAYYKESLPELIQQKQYRSYHTNINTILRIIPMVEQLLPYCVSLPASAVSTASNEISTSSPIRSLLVWDILLAKRTHTQQLVTPYPDKLLTPSLPRNEVDPITVKLMDIFKQKMIIKNHTLIMTEIKQPGYVGALAPTSYSLYPFLAFANMSTFPSAAAAPVTVGASADGTVGVSSTDVAAVYPDDTTSSSDPDTTPVSLELQQAFVSYGAFQLLFTFLEMEYLINCVSEDPFLVTSPFFSTPAWSTAISYRRGGRYYIPGYTSVSSLGVVIEHIARYKIPLTFLSSSFQQILLSLYTNRVDRFYSFFSPSSSPVVTSDVEGNLKKTELVNDRNDE
jgi:hypothetical protein